MALKSTDQIHAHRRAMGPLAARQLDARLEHVPTGDGAVVSVASLCASDDLATAVAELRRRVPDGARLHFVEHVGRDRLVTRLAGRVYASLPMGCHVGHDVPAALRRGGFTVTDLERFSMPSANPLLRHWVSGVAQ